MREQLVHSLRVQFEREVERSLGNIHEAMGPYTRFVRAESSKLHAAKNEFSNLQDALERIEIEIKSL